MCSFLDIYTASNKKVFFFFFKNNASVIQIRELVDHFVACCGNNPHILNVNKAKEMIKDFRTKIRSDSIFITEEEVKVVVIDFGVHLDNRQH